MTGDTNKYSPKASGQPVRRSGDGWDIPVDVIRGSFCPFNETIHIEMRSESSPLHDLSGSSLHHLFTGDEQVSDGSAVPICVLSMNLYRLSNNKREKINYTSLVLLE